jgi:hypothetical protein
MPATTPNLAKPRMHMLSTPSETGTEKSFSTVRRRYDRYVVAMMEPLSGLSDFLSILAELRFGQRSTFPFYCALLYTIAEGLDAELARYVDADWDELDGMTGEHCLVFVIGDARTEAAAGHRPFTPAEVYRVAEHLGVGPSSLPCAAFFTSPETSQEVLRIRLADYLLAASDGATPPETLHQGFRRLAAAVRHCGGLPEGERLSCLRERLVAEHERLFGAPPPSAGERLQTAGNYAGALAKVVTVASPLAAVFEHVFGLKFN